MNRPLEVEFQTEAPDASMAPDIPAGARLIFVTDAVAEPGDFVLVRDKRGNVYIREFKQVRPGHWQARAKNRAYLPLDSETDGLELLAVCDGVRGRLSQRPSITAPSA